MHAIVIVYRRVCFQYVCRPFTTCRKCYCSAEECTSENDVMMLQCSSCNVILRIRFVFKTIFFKKSLSVKINVLKLLLASIFSFATRVTKSYLDFYLSRKIKPLFMIAKRRCAIGVKSMREIMYVL